MTRTGTLAKYTSLILILIFLSPSLIKVTHFLYVHHEHSDCCHADKSELSKKHKICSICAFDFVEFIQAEKSYFAGAPELLSVYYPIYRPGVTVRTVQYCIFLRAPPFGFVS
ncbi:hypothetical protein EYV94_23070 [Puteibacter caeruleilacunae]|nr:hypothetical protein EYV94_23070 [Puteibacter caeruleilacunae]